MKTLLFSALLLCLPLAAQAACAPSDFAIKDLKTGMSGSGATTRLILSGELVNNCAEASAAQIRIDAKDSNGNVVQSKQGWPAGTTNMSPGDVAKFDLGRQFRYHPSMATYTATVVAVRAW